MRMRTFLAAATFLAGMAALSVPGEAKTAYQLWAQGRGDYVSSKDRLTTWQDDLAGIVDVPPPGAYRYHRYRDVPPPGYYDEDAY